MMGEMYYCISNYLIVYYFRVDLLKMFDRGEGFICKN